MRVVDPTAFPSAKRQKAKELYDEIAQAEVGTTFELKQGVDFQSAPATARQSIAAALRARGVIVATRVREGLVYLRIERKEAGVNGHLPSEDVSF